MKFYLKLSACIAVAVAYGLGLWLEPGSLFTLTLGLPVCIWLATVFHELGHLLAYWLLKLRWKRLAISCFVLERNKGLRIDREQKLLSAACACAYDPQVPFWRYRIALLSGGLLCLLLSAGAITGCFFAAERPASFLLCFGAACGLNGLINLLPFSADRRLLKKLRQKETPQTPSGS